MKMNGRCVRAGGGAAQRGPQDRPERRDAETSFACAASRPIHVAIRSPHRLPASSSILFHFVNSVQKCLHDPNADK